MADSVILGLELSNGYLQLDKCLRFRFEKERYAKSTRLTGKWILNSENTDEIRAVSLIVNGSLMHYGFPSEGMCTSFENGRYVLNINSLGFSYALSQNQPTAGLVTQIDLITLANSAIICPNVSYQPNTPIVNYVNYYEGTSIWDAIVCYSIRAVGNHPYIRGANTVRISAYPEELGTVVIGKDRLLSFGRGSDYSNIISEISQASYAGAAGAYIIRNQTALDRNIVRKKEKPFDHEWTMDPELGIMTQINYSMRGMNYHKIKYYGFLGGDLMDNVVVYNNDIPFVGRISKEIIQGNDGKVITTVYCYQDAYCS